MNEIAPVGHYFGAHEGDGTDYGFWLIDENEWVKLGRPSSAEEE